MREVYSLEHAYQLTQDYERFHKSPVIRRPEHFKTGILGPRPVMNQTLASFKSSMAQTPSRPPPVTFPARKDDKGKGVIGETSRTNSRIQCFKCNGIGHMASQCPSRVLHIGELENENLENIPEENTPGEEVYITDPELADNFEVYDTTHEEPEQSFTPEDRLGVVRCVLAQSKKSED